MSSLIDWNVTQISGRTAFPATVLGFNSFLESVFLSKAEDSSFRWELKSSLHEAGRSYLCVGRKNGSPGRLLIVAYNTTPALPNNPTFTDTLFSPSRIYVAYYPDATENIPPGWATATTPYFSNKDRALKAAVVGTFSDFARDDFAIIVSDEALGLICTFSVNSLCGFLAGELIYDKKTSEFIPSQLTFGNLNSITSTTMAFPFRTTSLVIGTTTTVARVFTEGKLIEIYQSFAPSGWANQSISAEDVMSDTTVNESYFVPIYFMTREKKPDLTRFKLRQIAIGEQSFGPLKKIYTSGPTLIAVSPSMSTGAMNGVPWFTYFEV